MMCNKMWVDAISKFGFQGHFQGHKGQCGHYIAKWVCTCGVKSITLENFDQTSPNLGFFLYALYVSDSIHLHIWKHMVSKMATMNCRLLEREFHQCVYILKLLIKLYKLFQYLLFLNEEIKSSKNINQIMISKMAAKKTAGYFRLKT